MKNKSKMYKGMVFLVLFSFVALTGAIVSTLGIGNATSFGSGNAISAAVDTVKWAREAGVVGLSFGLKFIDSANVKNIVVKRVVGGKVVNIPTVAVADTIAGAAVAGTVPYASDTVATTAGAPVTFLHAVTMTPYAEEYWFLVKYNNTATQATYKNGDTTAVKYSIIKQYSK